ncbi:MAG: ribosome silencing factor [Gammaproteobacteria bacterium]
MTDPVNPLLKNAKPISLEIRPLVDAITEALESLKAQNIVILPIGDISSIADAMILASGTSTTHVKAIADEVIEHCKTAGYNPIGIEGKEAAEWVLVDFDDVIVHIMLPATREFYDIERLWTARPPVKPEKNKSQPR